VALRFVPELEADLDVRRNRFAVALGGLVHVLLGEIESGGSEFGWPGDDAYGFDVASGID